MDDGLHAFRQVGLELGQVNRSLIFRRFGEFQGTAGLVWPKDFETYSFLLLVCLCL